jgi:hypothetical protein
MNYTILKVILVIYSQMITVKHKKRFNKCSGEGDKSGPLNMNYLAYTHMLDVVTHK